MRKKSKDIPIWLRKCVVKGWRIGYISNPEFPMPILILYVGLPEGKDFPKAFGFASQEV